MFPISEQVNEDMASIVAKVKESLVQVRCAGGGTGAGTVWHSEGLVITNAHVVQRPPVAVAFSNGRVFPAKIISYDAARDLAALVVAGSGLPTIDLGDSRNLEPGEWVMALGHPWGVRGALTAGVVIGVGPELPGKRRLKREWITVGLHLRPGYSGGPLLDVHGRLIGINTMMSGAGVGMAVPVHVVKAFLQDKLGS